MVTLKGSMSAEGETLQVSVLPYRCSICPPCCVCLGFCAAEFGSSGGAYELPCTWAASITLKEIRFEVCRIFRLDKVWLDIFCDSQELLTYRWSEGRPADSNVRNTLIVIHAGKKEGFIACDAHVCQHDQWMAPTAARYTALILRTG